MAAFERIGHQIGQRCNAVLAATAMVLFLAAAAPTDSPPAPALPYADLADLALAGPVAAHVRIDDAIRLKDEQATAVPAGQTRFYITADVLTLIRAPASMPGRIAYLADLPNLPDGSAPKLKHNSEQIVIGQPVAGRPGEFRLATPDAQLAYSPAIADRVRALLAEAAKADAAPRIVGIGRAFHVPGSLPGESETQIFLLAADGRPISLSILRRPGEQPRWGVALTEIVDDAAAPPAPDTLLWYRLACTLPRALPQQSLSEADPGQYDAIRADYALVLETLGPCTRTRRS